MACQFSAPKRKSLSMSIWNLEDSKTYLVAIRQHQQSTITRQADEAECSIIENLYWDPQFITYCKTTKVGTGRWQHMTHPYAQPYISSCWSCSTSSHHILTYCMKTSRSNNAARVLPLLSARPLEYSWSVPIRLGCEADGMLLHRIDISYR